VRAIEQRVPDWHHVDGADERRLALEVRLAGSGFTGRLTFAAGVRDVEGAECETVVRALALVAAVSLDPAAAEREAPAPAPVPVPAPAPVPPPEVSPRAGSPRPPPVRRPILSFGFGATGALLVGPAPDGLYGGAVHVELGDLERRFLLRAGGVHLVTESVTVRGVDADFSLSAGELAGCYRWSRPEPIGLGGCLVLTAGVLSATATSGAGLIDTGSSTRFWGSTAGRAAAFLRPFPALEIGAEVGTVIAWLQHSYTIETPKETIYETGLIGADLRVGLTVVLP
jgi:hypothetical protein